MIHENRWVKSQELLARASRSLAGGVSSPFRAKAPIPLFLADAQGSRIIDADGNEYIDYALGWGPLILGHCHPAIVETVAKQAVRPHTYGAQHALEFEVAEAIQRIVPCAERVAFTSSGSEALQLLMRLARAYTRRPLVVKFEGHYHGWMDSILLSYKPTAEQLKMHADPTRGILGSTGQVPNAAENVIVAPWNDLEAIERVFFERGDEIAAVLTEPVLCNSGCLLPHAGYLSDLATIARKHGALLCFDEVITGFRITLGGAQSKYGVTPDIASFGKAIGGGLPLSAVCGRQDIMEMMFNGGVAFGGTFNGNPLSLAAAATTIAELEAANGCALTNANRLGQELMHAIEERAQQRGFKLLTTGFGAAFALHFTSRTELTNYRDTLGDDRHLLERFWIEALRNGIYTVPDGRMYVSAVHSADDVERTIAAVDRTLAAISAPDREQFSNIRQKEL